jgi:hypothetical protein
MGASSMTTARAMGFREGPSWREQTVGPSTAPLAMRLREAPLRMTLLLFGHIVVPYLPMLARHEGLGRPESGARC